MVIDVGVVVNGNDFRSEVHDELKDSSVVVVTQVGKNKSKVSRWTVPAENVDVKVLEGGDKLAFDDPVYMLAFSAQPDFDSDVLNLFYSSLAKPGTSFAHNMTTGARVTKHVVPVLGGFDSNNYESIRLWASSHDGVKVCLWICGQPAAWRSTKYCLDCNSCGPARRYFFVLSKSGHVSYVLTA